ncbi:MAG: ubiquinol-cytochrome c reductase core subunit 1 [Alyxoria varia]|nr:MAG: ubiquinol-cytochrome c reductase core subunit 1 [Alyxoria varia]
MVVRARLPRHAINLVQHPSLRAPACRRGLAAPASGSFQYQTGEVEGVKYASRDLAGPTTTLALVAKAGSRYQPMPGLAEGLEKYAFRNTDKRSALRLHREVELFGASLFSYHTRESVVIGAKFFRDDLPYFVEALGEVATQTKYLDYEFDELVLPQIHIAQHHQLQNPTELALASAHSLAFHRGLGEPVNPIPSTPVEKYLSSDAIGAYSTLAYRKPNVAVVANGADLSEVRRWVGEYFGSMRMDPAPGLHPLEGDEQAKYYGGEERIAHSSSNAMVIAFPGSSSLTGGFYRPEIAVLAALLGGRSAIKWSPGFSLLGQDAATHSKLNIETKSAIYSDAGLLHINISGPSATAVTDAAASAATKLKDLAAGKLSSELFNKARARARFQELEYGQAVLAGLELTGAGLVRSNQAYQLDESADRIEKVTEKQVKDAAKGMLEFKASVSTVGDLWQLPYAEELGLKV